MADCLPCGAKEAARKAKEKLLAEAQARSAAFPRVLALVHKYPPTHNAGAEWMLHHTLRYLNGRGGESRVLTTQPVRPPIRDEYGGVFDGVHLTPQPGTMVLERWARWANVLFTHLDETGRAMRLGLRFGLPEVHLVHNHRQLAYHKVTPDARRLAVFNSEWTRQENGWSGASLVVHPPVPPDYYRIAGQRGDGILLVNPTGPKGGHLFYALAAALPQFKFLVVAGAYGKQIPPPPLPNLELLRPSPKITDHLARAALVLVPSSYESWGRVAVEAACSGIPSIVSDAPGLVESMGTAARVLPVATTPSGMVGGRPTEDVVAHPALVGAWRDSILEVLGAYQTHSEMARRRSIELWSKTVHQLSALDARIREMMQVRV